MWSRLDILGLFSINVVPFSRNVVVLSGPWFSLNLGPEQRMFLGQAIYVLGPLHLVCKRLHANASLQSVTKCIERRAWTLRTRQVGKRLVVLLAWEIELPLVCSKVPTGFGASK